MQDDSDSPSRTLDGLVSDALNRSLDTSLDSLDALRKAVRSYTLHQRNRGVPLESIQGAISTVLDRLEDERSQPDELAFPDRKLARRLSDWCSKDYGDTL
jgi:hypothetical protein